MEEALDDVIMGPKDLSQIVKGKRTKRQRTQSPIHNFAIATHSSSGEGGEGNSSNGDYYNTTTITTTNNNNNNNNNYSSSSGEFRGDSVGTTEEDENTAKCLILLSQGHSQIEYSLVKTNHNNNNKSGYVGMYKFSSKKYVETPTTGNGKVGIYVYECRTCNRTFPSFQALGGHRASHKKPKNVAEDAKRKALAIGSLSDDEEFLTPPPPPALKSNNNNNVASSSSPPRQLTSNKNNNNGNSKASPSSSRAHGCSICGAEFMSGQALGGHMRRHWAAAPAVNTTIITTATNMASSLSTTPLRSPVAIDYNSEDSEKEGINSMPLDLNFPPPRDEHHLRQSKLFFTSKQQRQPPPSQPLPQQLPPPPPTPPQVAQKQQQQQQKQSALVLSAGPALVDCHY